MSRKPIVAAAGLLLLACGIALAQQPPPPLGPASVPPLSFDPPSVSPLAPPVASPEQTLDQLLDAMEKLRTQKAELEKREQELLKVIQRKATQQKERMDKLGVNVMVHPLLPPVPPVLPDGSVPRFPVSR